MPDVVYLPNNYTPFNKGKCCWLEIIQGLYGEFTKILIWVYIVIAVSTTIRIYVLNGSCMCFCGFAGITFLFVGCFFYFLKKCKVQNDYREFEEEFKKILNKIKK